MRNGDQRKYWNLDYIFCTSCGAKNGAVFVKCFMCKEELKELPDDYCNLCGCEQ